MPLGPYDPSDPVVLEVSVAGRDALCSFWQSLIGESQCRPLGCWRKARHPQITTHSPFEKQFLAFYRSIVKTECLIMGH